MAQHSYFGPELFQFLSELKANNDRQWFAENRSRYERQVKEPLLQFIADFAPRLQAISPCFEADSRPVGGSMFRLHRDTRFSKDKSPYKTHAAAHFRHEAGKDAHATGFYLHLEPDSCLAGGGIWHPDSPALDKIRSAIVEHPDRWQAVTPTAGRPCSTRSRPSAATPSSVHPAATTRTTPSSQTSNAKTSS
jgi:uncharacterized protein (TIGR02453 family)